MQIIKSFLVASIFVLPTSLFAQTTYFDQGSKDYDLLDRLEIKMQKDTILNFSFVKPYSRKWWAGALERVEKAGNSLDLSDVDMYNIRHSKMNNMEWMEAGLESNPSKHSILHTFYKDPVNFIGIKQKDFFLSVNPVLQFQVMKDNKSSENLYYNARGVRVRSLIGKNLSFQMLVTDNQEKMPVFASNIANAAQAVQGVGFYKGFKGSGYDYFDARGSIAFNASKYLDLQFGYDKAFIGNGYRSLFISDYSNSHLFLNMNLHVWRLNYISRIMELTSQKDSQTGTGQFPVYPKKYAAFHHISFNAPKWLTLGLFDAVVFSRPNYIELTYLNPIIFMRAAEHQNGSPDNALVGFDAKANLAKRVQVYGQVMLDEFYLKYLRQHDGWWSNKWALQAGLKYIDVLGVKNLDLQLETNWIRPFTYSHFDNISNYTHYNQPLAHPLGSNVREFIGILKMQPLPKWRVQAKAIYWKKGMDGAGQNYGNNIFLSYLTRTADFGNFFGAPLTVNTLNTNLWVSYEFRENLFLEGNMSSRKVQGSSTNVFSSIGLRWNMQRREYDY